MNIQLLTTFFMWCTVINFGLLMFSFVCIVSARDFVYRLHGRWFPMPRETFNAVLYGFLGFYKILWLVFNVVPWIVLTIMA